MSQSLNVELRYGSEKHRKVLDALLARVQISERFIANKEEDLRNADQQYQGYLSDTGNSSGACQPLGGDATDDSDDYTTLFIPYSYATLLAGHTYWSSVFLTRSPVLQFAGRHGESEDNVLAVESLIDYQVGVGGMMPALYVWMLDAAKYGFGVLCNYWDEETVTVSKIEETPVLDPMGYAVPGKTKKELVRAETQGYVGNRAFNVNPYDFLPDPRVPIVELQRGEFVGRYVDIGWNDMVRGREDGTYFNVDVVKARNLSRNANKAQQWDPDSMLPDIEEDISTADIKDVGMTKCINLFVELIPQEWGLGQGRMPEKWVFTVADKEVVIEARPYGALHNKYPFFVLTYEVDGYSVFPRGMMALLKPLNDTLTWLINSHFFNVRSVLNNNMIVDPSRVNIADITAKGAGKLIRLRREAWGTDARSALMQIPVADVTASHLKDAQIVGDIIQRVSAVTDNVMGMVNAGGRKTATEIRSSNTFGISRLKTTAEFWSEIGYKPFAQVLLQQTQQYYDMERMYRIAGDNGKIENMIVTSESIAGFYDYVPVDGTLPVDRYAQANLWREILMGLMKMPQLAMTFNIPAIFEWTAQLAGLKNIKRFRVRVAPDQVLAAAAAAGSVLPMGGQQGGIRNANAGLVERRLGSPPGTGQISGMGPAG